MRPGWLLLVAVLTIGGCSGSSPDPLEVLREASTTPIHARMVNGLVRDVSGTFEGIDAATFVRRYAGLFGVNDVTTELSAPEESLDGPYGTVSYTRRTSGVPIYGAEIRLHTVGGNVVLVTAPLPSNAAIGSPEPALTPMQAAARFHAAFGLTADAAVISSELVAFNEGLFTGEASSTVLAYHVRSGVYAPEQREGFVDAASGELLFSYPTQQFLRDRWVAHYEYRDACAPVCGIEDIVDFAHAVWFDENGSFPDVTPSAHGSLLFTKLGDVYDYYATRFGRDGIDGRGGRIAAFLNHPAEATVSPAFWSPDEQAMFLRDQYVSSEAIAHEYAHGVVMAGSALGSSGEAGALHEAFADVMAVLANGGDEWTIREADDTLIRDLSRPVIDKYGSYLPLVDSDHEGSGPFSLATYLLANGGTHPTNPGPAITPIAIAKLEQIYYRAITKPYLQRRSDMEDALFGLVRACADLVFDEAFGVEPRDCGSIWNAFAAVGLGERDDDRDMFPNSVDNCDRYNPDQADVNPKNGIGDACEGASGPFPMEPPTLPACLPFYHGATSDAGVWIPEDWPLLSQSEVEVLELRAPINGVLTPYYEFRTECLYDCFGCGAGSGGVRARLTWQPFYLEDYGFSPSLDYQRQCDLSEDALTGQIGPFYSSTALARINLNFGIPNNQVYNDRQTIYLDAMMTSLEVHSASCP